MLTVGFNAPTLLQCQSNRKVREMRSPARKSPQGITDPRNPVNRDDAIGDIRYL
jgi:hypothetical protein